MRPDPRLVMALPMLALVACTSPAIAPACIDAATGTVHVQARNDGPTALQVPPSRPDIGCCRRSGLSIAVTDAAGRELDRCGFADNFDNPRLRDLPPGAAVDYALDAASLSRVYCQVDLARHHVTAYDGGRSLGTHPLVPCGARAPDR